MPKEKDIFDERGPYKMQVWGFSNDVDKLQVKVVIPEMGGHMFFNIDKTKPVSSIKKTFTMLHKMRGKLARSYKEHFKRKK